MRHWAVGVTALLVVVTFAGCFSGAENDDGEIDTAPPVTIIGTHPLPEPDGERAHAWLVDYLDQFPMRVTGSPNEIAAASHIVATLESYGYAVDVKALPPQGLALPTSALRVIVGIMPGNGSADHWLAWGGHYDTVPQTVEGAYDNGAGIAVSLELAAALADVPTNRTKAVILFNGEEQGVLASAEYVRAYQQQDDYVIDLFVGFDMTGINHPAPGHPLAFFSGGDFGDVFVPMAENVAYDLLGFPDDGSISIHPTNSRNSDESQFASAGIPTMRFAGMERASDYSGYHTPDDTMATIYAASGPDATTGEANFKAGMANTVAFAYAMILANEVAGPPPPVD